jgi:hypothetical protein
VNQVFLICWIFLDAEEQSYQVSKPFRVVLFVLGFFAFLFTSSKRAVASVFARFLVLHFFFVRCSRFRFWAGGSLSWE